MAHSGDQLAFRMGRRPTKAELVACLQQHIGRENGATAELLAARLGTHARVVRELVTEARIDGIAVCGHPSSGYFIAKTAEELEETCQFLRARALHSLSLEARLRGLPLADLVGQLRLKT